MSKLYAFLIVCSIIPCAHGMDKPNGLRRINAKKSPNPLWTSIIEKARNHKEPNHEIKEFFQTLFDRGGRHGLFVVETNQVIIAQVTRYPNLTEAEKGSVINTLKNYCSSVFNENTLEYHRKETARLEGVQKELHDKLTPHHNPTPE
jgi:hypothetical protein